MIKHFFILLVLLFGVQAPNAFGKPIFEWKLEVQFPDKEVKTYNLTGITTDYPFPVKYEGKMILDCLIGYESANHHRAVSCSKNGISFGFTTGYIRELGFGSNTVDIDGLNITLSVLRLQ